MCLGCTVTSDDCTFFFWLEMIVIFLTYWNNETLILLCDVQFRVTVQSVLMFEGCDEILGLSTSKSKNTCLGSYIGII